MNEQERLQKGLQIFYDKSTPELRKELTDYLEAGEMEKAMELVKKHQVSIPEEKDKYIRTKFIADCAKKGMTSRQIKRAYVKKFGSSINNVDKESSEEEKPDKEKAN